MWCKPCSTKPRVNFISTLPELYVIKLSKKLFEDLCSKLTLIDVFGHMSRFHNFFQLKWVYMLNQVWISFSFLKWTLLRSSMFAAGVWNKNKIKSRITSYRSSQFCWKVEDDDNFTKSWLFHTDKSYWASFLEAFCEYTYIF